MVGIEGTSEDWGPVALFGFLAYGPLVMSMRRSRAVVLVSVLVWKGPVDPPAPSAAVWGLGVGTTGTVHMAGHHRTGTGTQTDGPATPTAAVCEKKL